MRNLDDGIANRFHPHLMRPATDDEARDLRIGIIKNADDVEVANPLGTAKGQHKECGVQAATANLPPAQRFAERNIMLVALAKAKVHTHTPHTHTSRPSPTTCALISLQPFPTTDRSTRSTGWRG